MSSWLRILFILVALFAVASRSHAVIETYEFASEQQRLRYQHLTEVLRCPKCQNQNLAGSNSPIAADLRREVVRQIREGASDQDIVDFMVTRYGEFILYDPPVRKSTAVLWFAPAALLLGGILVLWLIIRSSRAAVAASSLSASEQQRLDALVKPGDDGDRL